MHLPRVVAVLRALVSLLLFGSMVTSCSTTDRSKAMARFPAEANTKVDLASLEPGVILITPGTNDAEVAADPPNRRVEPLSEGAADATRSFLNTPNLGNPQLEAAVGAVQFTLAPFAAAYGAISAGQKRLSALEASEAQQRLLETMSSNALPQTLIQSVTEIGRQKTRRLLRSAGTSSDAPAKEAPVSAMLRIAVKRFQLKAASPGASEYVLFITASARLERAPDGRVLFERSYDYESSRGMYIDWTRLGGLEYVARTGYDVLAGQIATDIFEPISQAPIVIGPGPKHSQASSPRLLRKASEHRYRESRAQPAYRHAVFHLSDKPRLLWVRQVMRNGLANNTNAVGSASFSENVGAIEIHTGKTDDRIRSPKPGPQSGSDTGTMSETKYSLDGLEEDRNAVVQGLSCVAAVPFGLWEQTVGAVSRSSRERAEEYSRTLNAVTTREHLEQDLADRVAGSLQTQVADSVRRTEDPIRIASSGLGGAGPLAVAKGTTALEIQVLSTSLVPKHRHSSSRVVVVEVQATLFRTSDGQELYSRPVQYRSSGRRLKAWAGSDARLYRLELENCLHRTAQAVVNDLVTNRLVTPLPASERSGSGHPN